jgi:hypothetical protein
VIPGGDLIIGLFVQLIVWLVLRFVRFCFGILRSAFVDHPGLTAVFLITAIRRGWIDVTMLPWLAPWVPLILSLLFVFGFIRFFTEHPPTGILHTADRHRRRFERSTGKAAADGAWVRDRFRRKDAEPETHAGPSLGDEVASTLPPPPQPVTAEAIPMGPAVEKAASNGR